MAQGFVVPQSDRIPAAPSSGGMTAVPLPAKPDDPIDAEYKRLRNRKLTNDLNSPGGGDTKPQPIPGRPGWFMDASGNAFQPKGLPPGNSSGTLTPSAYSKIQGQLKALKLVEAQLNRVEALYKKNLQGVGLQSFAEYLPTPGNRAFQTAADGILPLVRQALSTSAKDGDSDRELSVWQNLIPAYRLMDAENEERIATMRRLISENRKATQEMLGGQKPAETGGFRIIRKR